MREQNITYFFFFLSLIYQLMIVITKTGFLIVLLPPELTTLGAGASDRTLLGHPKNMTN